MYQQNPHYGINSMACALYRKLWFKDRDCIYKNEGKVEIYL